MQTSRFNGFNQIHKALRTLMFDTIMQVQQVDLSDVEASRPAIEQVELLLDHMDDHADHEDHFILHPAESHAPDLICEFESEHVIDLRLSSQLMEKIAAYRASEDRLAAGREVYYALNAFVAFNLQHMNKEEQVLNEVLWQHYSDGELLSFVRNIQQSIAPEKAAVTMKWMIKGMNNVELLQWFKAVQAEAPAPVYQMLLGAARELLTQDRWAWIQGRL